MKNLLRVIKNWANESNGKMILVSVLSVLVIGLPFMIGIYFISTTIKNETLYMSLDLVLFLLYGVSYVMFTKYINKV
jgi:hypothetical protein